MLNLQARRLDDAYLPKTKQVVDIGPFQSVDIKSVKKHMCCASRVGEELKAKSILDETQVQAVDLVLRQRLAIIQVNACYLVCIANMVPVTVFVAQVLCVCTKVQLLFDILYNSHGYVQYHSVDIQLYL